MGILTSLLRKRMDTDVAHVREQRGLSLLNMVDFFGGETFAGPQVTEESSLRSTAVFACVRIISESIASLPLVLYRRNGRNKQRATTHPLYRLLHDQPNPALTALEFREMMLANVLLWGTAFAEKDMDSRGRVRALWPLRTGRMEDAEWRAGQLWYAYRLPDQKVQWLDAANLFIVRGLSADGFFGYSPIGVAARQAVGVALATEEYGARFFSNGARPGGVLKHPGALSPPAYERLKQSFDGEVGGLSNAHRMKILEEGMDYQAIGIPPEEAQFLETRKFQVTDIARVFRVPPHLLGDLDRATFCLPADTEIFTTGGPKRIADVSVGEQVWSWDGSQYVKSWVSRSDCTGNDEILEMRTTNRTLRANAKHRVLARRKYADPQPGPGGYQAIEWRTEYVPVGELQVGDTLVALDELPEGMLTEINGRTLTAEFMEFCGLLLGDGNVAFGQGVTIARANAALYMDHYREVMQSEFVSFGRNGNGRVRRDVALQPVALREGERQIRFSSVLAAEELTKLGLSGDARSKSVPAWVFDTPRELKLAFLRGFLDADGSVDKKGRIAYHSVNRRMLSQMRHLCVSVGVPVTNLRHQAINTTLPNGDSFIGEIFTFTCSDPGMNREIGSYDPRYQMRLQDGKPFGRKARAYPRYGGKEFDIAGCGLTRINSIEKRPAEPVYDLEVVGTHSFVADGVIVHNSNIEHQSLEFVMHTLRPWLVRIEQSITRDLISPAQQNAYFVRHIVEGLLRGDTQSRYQAYQSAINTGWMTRNEARELEDLNTEEGLDTFLQPLNMIEAGEEMPENGPERPAPTREQLRQQAREGWMAPDEYRRMEIRQDKTRAFGRYVRLFEEAAGRLIRRETNDIRRAVNKFVGKRNIQDFQEWLADFYKDLRGVIPDYFDGLMRSLAEEAFDLVAEELGQEAPAPEDLDEWIRTYLENFASVHAVGAEKQIRALIAEAEDEEAAGQAIVERMDGWEETQPGKVGKEQAFEAGNALAVLGYSVMGVRELVWAGGDCPICRRLNGTRIPISGAFAGPGDVIDPEDEETEPFPVQRTVKHGPLHNGCDCVLVAG